MQSGSTLLPTGGKESVHESMPTGTWVVMENMVGLYYSRMADFEEIGKMYGSHDKMAERIIRTYLSREKTTGVLLSGDKGSGKSLLARLVSVKGYKLGIPTIVVNHAFTGDAFAKLLASVEQPAIVLMDEFEKVYSREEQEAVLTLLDGMSSSNKLFILTVNDKYRVDNHMRNRPGRLFYSLEFSGVDSEFVREYCNDNLDNKDHVDAVVNVSALFESFNFDILKALVEEMNRYEEDPHTALEWLNAKPYDEPVDVQYDVEAWHEDGTLIDLDDSVLAVTPLTARGGRLNVAYTQPGETADDDFSWESIELRPRHLVGLNADEGRYEFVSDDKERVVFTKKKREIYDTRSLTF